MTNSRTDGHRVESPRAVGKASELLAEYDERAVHHIELKVTVQEEERDE